MVIHNSLTTDQAHFRYRILHYKFAEGWEHNYCCVLQMLIVFFSEQNLLQNFRLLKKTTVIFIIVILLGITGTDDVLKFEGAVAEGTTTLVVEDPAAADDNRIHHFMIEPSPQNNH